jgi:hypothetical protein
MMPPALVNVMPSTFDPEEDLPRPVGAAESLRRYGTIGIALEVMQDRIRFATPHLNPTTHEIYWRESWDGQVNAWMFFHYLPQHLHEVANDAMLEALQPHVGKKSAPDLLRVIIERAHRIILRELERRGGFRQFALAWVDVGVTAALAKGLPLWNAQQLLALWDIDPSGQTERQP